VHLFKVISLCLGVIFFSFHVSTGWAGKAVPQPSPASKNQAATNPDKAGDVPEARTLSEKVTELIKAGKYYEALPLAEQALAIREKTLGPEHPKVISSLINLGDIRFATGYWYDAISTFQRALKISEKTLGPEHPDTAACLRRLALQYLFLGFYDRALPLAKRALEITKKVQGPEHEDNGSSMGCLARIYLEMGAVEQALPLAQQALRIQEKTLGAENLDTAESLSTLALIYRVRGAATEALPFAQRALEIREKILGSTTLEHQHLLNLRLLGYIYLDLKNYQQSENYFQRATQGTKASAIGSQLGLVELYLASGRYEEASMRLSRLSPSILTAPGLRIQYYTLKGLSLRGLGQRENSYSAFLEAINIIEDLRNLTPGERTGFFRSGVYSGNIRAYQGVIGLLAEMAERGEAIPSNLQGYGSDPATAAFYFAEAIKARSLLEAMASEANKSFNQQLPSDLQARENGLQDSLVAIEAQRIESQIDRKKATSFQSKSLALKSELERFVAEIRNRVPRYAALKYPRPYKAQELPLKPGELLLEYCLGKQESYLFRVEPGGKTQVFRLALGQEALEKRLGFMLAPFRQSVLRRDDLSKFAIRDAASLYQEILATVLAGVNPGTRLIIVPDGALGAFPFEALVVQAGADWSKSTLVGDRWPVTYSQSAAILALNRQLGHTKAPQPIFALGDPIFEKGSSRYVAYKTGQGKAGELKHAGPEKALTMAATGKGWGQLVFPPLPETRQTVTELATLFQVVLQPPQVLLDVNATETRVRQSPLSQYRYLFFGTHGFLADKMAGVQEPTLVLTQVENKPPDNGFLTFSKVLQLKLNADLVALAACMTGVGQVMQGEGVLNFARAFQQAGARSVMVALWNIPVEESLKFYSTFYKALKEGKTKLQALQTARQAIRAKEPHPYFWSGLILHGEG
jgi:CHAT domain-containing protein